MPYLLFPYFLNRKMIWRVSFSIHQQFVFPTSRNTSTIAMEYQIEPELHAQIVLFSTLFSIITVTVVIYLSYILF